MALVHSRIGRVFYGVRDRRRGALGSKYLIHTEASLNHRFEVHKGKIRQSLTTNFELPILQPSRMKTCVSVTSNSLFAGVLGP